MMKVRFFLLFYILGFNIFYSQKILKPNPLKEYSYLDLKTKFDEYYYRDATRESNLIALYFLQKAKAEKNQSQIAEGYVLMQFNANFPNALKYVDSIQAISKDLDKKIYPAKIYLLRGNTYFKFDNLKNAFENYLVGLKYAKENKNERQIAFIEVNIAYLQNYIGKHKEAAKTFRYYLNHPSSLYGTERNQIHQNLTDAYIEINKLDSAKILINEGFQYSLENKDKYNYYKYLSLSGFYNVKLEDYKKAVNDLLICKKYFSADITDLNINYTLFVLGKAYIGLHEKDHAAQSFIEIDSIVQKTNNTFPELREVYTYLIDYYKEKNNKEKQLYYIERFLKVDQKLDEQFKYLSAELPRKYDTPNLLQEKEHIINDLENRKTILSISIGSLSMILLLVSFLYYKSKKTEKKHRKIAQDLIHSIEERNFETPTPKSDAIQIQNSEQTDIEDKTSKTTPEEVTQFILQELEVFESKELFLRKGITSASLAKSIKTNTTYLSEVINTQKGKNFATYLNDLRINYALNRLIKDRKFRSYKLSVIADELGYNNEQAFSLAFKKKTGITLSIYIKEIEKDNHN